MAILEQIMQMKSQGMADREISTRLQEQGVSPRAIMDALNQSKIKEAVEKETEEEQESFERGIPPQPTGSETYTPSTYESNERQENYQEPYYSKKSSEEYYPQEGYGESYAPERAGTDTIIEIAEQVFEEKMKKIEKNLEEIGEFSVIANSKLSNFQERIMKIENMIENLQIKILEKVGSYGQGLDSIRKEMSMMQDSFSKTLPKIFESKTIPIKKVEGKKPEMKKSVSKRK